MTDAVSLIRAKRDGQRLADDDIRWLFDAYARHEVADEQMSALLMAIYFRGLDRAELRTWTAAMIASGDRLDLSSVGRATVDKIWARVGPWAGARPGVSPSIVPRRVVICG